ncbi:hypothetical protein CWI38_0957p0030 [Hamiltosporidium tvaerminnensis]|uniref:Uncharacterized protein n=1 Tax=Hamiltosporidium tvaerminnensis TaxID=1176355 RepID=A0A4Q9LDE9_9MICR|nr:hypothetical protein LUQ84_000471 [Hamiltosporidium tvaerminnensis]TBU05455.1 hypothetical protein CWI37_0011p0070 [Hamiltosporidium tvaerminnensis]TBU11973.1 hypothetical protein CWI38_0957p0030 [Hamiltosporidium tvaerminnensis]
MELELSPHNARILDSLLKTETIIIKISENIIIQELSDSKSLLIQITLFPLFFTEYLQNDLNFSFSFSTPKFFKKGMKSLRIVITDLIISLSWKFNTYNYYKEIYISSTELYSLDFNEIKSINLDLVLLFEIIKYLKSDVIVLKFLENYFIISGENKSEKAVVYMENNFNEILKFPQKNIKTILELMTDTDECMLSIDALKKTACFISKFPEYLLSIFTALL